MAQGRREGTPVRDPKVVLDSDWTRFFRVEMMGFLLLVLPLAIFFLKPFVSPLPERTERSGQVTAQLLWQHAGQTLSGTPGKIGMVVMGVGVIVIAAGFLVRD
jgi:hypothetical protein